MTATDQCPVDRQSRQEWLRAAKASRENLRNGNDNVNGHASIPSFSASTLSTLPPTAMALLHRHGATKYSLDHGSWQVDTSLIAIVPNPSSNDSRLPTDREISTIPRAPQTQHQHTSLNSAERAVLPANSERDTGHDRPSGNWVYPSQDMFFNAMKRKGHDPQAADMSAIVPIHNAVNERAWAEIKSWEAGRGSEACGGPKLVSFSGDSSRLTPRARWNVLMGYQPPFDRHDWTVDRCGKHIEYVIDFYSGKGNDGKASGLNFYLDVRPKLNHWEGVRTRFLKSLGL